MVETDDSVSGPSPLSAFLSNTDQFLTGDDDSWINMLGSTVGVGDSNENQGDHDPPPLQHLEGTRVSILDHEWGWLNEFPQPAGINNYNSSDCCSAAASDAPSLNSFLTAAAASDAVSPFSLNRATVEADNGNAAVMINHQQELRIVLEMDNSHKHLTSCNSHLLSLESDEDDSMSIESNEGETQPQSTVNLRGEAISKVNSQIPEIGMVFLSEEEAYKSYKTYAKEIGFSVRKAKVRRLSNGEIKKRFLFCSREGFRAKNQSAKTPKYQRKETRTGCDARVEFTVENGKWVISGFKPEHNHNLEGKPKLIDISEDHSLSVTMNKAGMVKDAGPSNSVGFHSIDCSSSSHDEKTSHPQLLDGQGLINFFRHLQMEDPSFFYTEQVNAENCLTNFFWTDGRSRMDYEYFGDVVILDTTFRIAAYDMIYAPFLGINHHKQYVLFGGALLLDDSKDSFIWLLSTFLDSMGGRQPRTIITDGCQAMADATEAVLPKAQHLLGIWYILRNAKANLSKCYGQSGFDRLFKECIFGCESEEEFESMWASLLEKYNLSTNPWLNNLYGLRRKWSHCFCKTIFSAGIRSNQHFESTSHVFHCLTSKAITPLEFVQQYSKVAEQQRREELCEDFRCNENAPPIILISNAVEKEAAKIYSCTMFKLFQAELLECLSVALEEIPGDGMTDKFRLTEVGHMKEKIVEFNCVENRLTCSCKKYESVGILCVHALKVLNAKNIFHIPPQYISKRWTKSAKDGMVDGLEEVADDSHRHMPLSKSKLMHNAINFVIKSFPFEETRMIADNYMNVGSKEIEDVLRTKNIGHLNITDGDKDAAADAMDNICVETQKMESNPTMPNQEEAANHRTKSQLKRKRDNNVRETMSKSSDGAITHRHSFREVTNGGDYHGSKRGASSSYSMGENSRQSMRISPRPPLPSQYTCNQFKDQNKFRGNVQATQVRREEVEKEITKLRQQNQRKLALVSMHNQQKILLLEQQLEAVRGDSSRVSVTVESFPEQNHDGENFNGGSNFFCLK